MRHKNGFNSSYAINYFQMQMKTEMVHNWCIGE